VTIVVRPIPVNASHNFPLTIHGDQTAGTNTIQVSGVGVTPLFSASGIVRDEVDGAPIAGAEVRIQTGHYVGLVTTTDGNGYYSIGGIAGDVGLIAHKAGYTSFGHFVTMLSDTRLDMTLRRSSR
jgi:hypothetical protein